MSNETIYILVATLLLLWSVLGTILIHSEYIYSQCNKCFRKFFKRRSNSSQELTNNIQHNIENYS